MSRRDDDISLNELKEKEIELETDYDKQAEDLLKLEGELQALDGSEADLSQSYETGTVVAAERILTSEVPNSYPEQINTPYALSIGVQLDPDRKTTVYLEWPETLEEDTQITRLLTLLDISPGSFADILGREIPLERVKSRYIVYLPSEIEDVSSNWYYGIIGCLSLWIFFFIFLPENAIVGGLLLLAWFGLPLATYFDSKYLKSRSTWNPNKWFWTVAMFIWLINIPAAVVYLYKRHKAEFAG